MSIFKREAEEFTARASLTKHLVTEGLGEIIQINLDFMVSTLSQERTDELCHEIVEKVHKFKAEIKAMVGEESAIFEGSVCGQVAAFPDDESKAAFIEEHAKAIEACREVFK